ncbi:MAG: hypothetical protein FWD78_12020 [Treponema sp.]|nr:hypothetical protein [Treponema sp.]
MASASSSRSCASKNSVNDIGNNVSWSVWPTGLRPVMIPKKLPAAIILFPVPLSLNDFNESIARCDS